MVTSNVQLFLPDGRSFSHPSAVEQANASAFTAGAGSAVQGVVDPHYRADLAARHFEMSAGVAFTTTCGSSCSALTVNLGTFIIAQQFKLTSPDRAPIEVTASWTTLASIDMPVDAWISAQIKLGLVSGAYTPVPLQNFWQQCWANGDSAATKARCPSFGSVRVPLDTPDTRSVTVRVASGSTLQLEVFAGLNASVPLPSGTRSHAGTMLLDPLMQILVLAGTLVQTGAFPVTVVPEPPAALLALAGLAGLAAGRRRGPVSRWRARR